MKEPWEIPLMRRSGRKLAEVLALLAESVREGVSTKELDEVAEKAIRDRGGIPSFKGYQPGPDFPPYPASICASVNETVVHGIPNERPLRKGDIVSIDVGLIYGGYHADTAVTTIIGERPHDTDETRRIFDDMVVIRQLPRARQKAAMSELGLQVGRPVSYLEAIYAEREPWHLVAATKESLRRAIAAATVGNRIGDIGHAVESYVTSFGFGIVEAYVGHGIGRAMHEAPSVPNVGKKGKGQLLKAGMCLAIEPMVTAGSARTEVLGDRWTVVTEDRSLAAHFEHTVVLTPTGPEVLTVLEGTGALT